VTLLEKDSRHHGINLAIIIYYRDSTVKCSKNWDLATLVCDTTTRSTDHDGTTPYMELWLLIAEDTRVLPAIHKGLRPVLTGNSENRYRTDTLYRDSWSFPYSFKHRQTCETSVAIATHPAVARKGGTPFPMSRPSVAI